MTAVALAAIFVNSTTDPSDFRAFDSVSSLQPSDDLSGSIRVMANGRRRLVMQDGAAKTYSVGLRVTGADIAWLVAHAGQLLCFRDDQGEKFFGTYLSVPRDRDPGFPDRIDFTLKMESLTHSQAV